MKLFTSEFVAQGHPDRYTDVISNTILDSCLKQDPDSRVAVEALAKDNKVVLGGEITTSANIDVEQIVKDVTKELGYDWEPEIINFLGKQSPDIAMGTNDDANGAGDQGIMFGYATSEGPEFMPLAWSIARDIIKAFEDLFHGKHEDFKWIKPDMKSQVTIDYSDAIPKVNTVVISIQTEVGTDLDKVRPLVKNVIQELIGEKYGSYVDLSDDWKILFNETGKFEIGGPYGDAGVTGRKIVVDQYGGYAPVGGGNLNGKDPTKVDRSAAYMMRYLAKNLVAADLLSDCTIQCAYCIGVSQPVSLNIQTSDDVSDKYLEDIAESIMNNYDLSPRGIIQFLELKEPRYVETAKYGHYGNDYATWEQIDEDFKNKLGIN